MKHIVQVCSQLKNVWCLLSTINSQCLLIFHRYICAVISYQAQFTLIICSSFLPNKCFSDHLQQIRTIHVFLWSSAAISYQTCVSLIICSFLPNMCFSDHLQQLPSCCELLQQVKTDVPHETPSEGLTTQKKVILQQLPATCKQGQLWVRGEDKAQRHTCTHLCSDADFAQFSKLGLWWLGQKFWNR